MLNENCAHMSIGMSKSEIQKVQHQHLSVAQKMKLTVLPKRKLGSAKGGDGLFIGRLGGLVDLTNRCVVVHNMKLGKKSF